MATEQVSRLLVVQESSAGMVLSSSRSSRNRPIDSDCDLVSGPQQNPSLGDGKGRIYKAFFNLAAPVQSSLQAGSSFERMSNRLRFDPSDLYLKCQRNSALEQVILYDISTRRAWLVSLLFVLHHMLLAYTHVEK
jgi:hypothetical protein